MPAGALIDSGIVAATFGAGGAWDATRNPVALATGVPLLASEPLLSGAMVNTQPVAENPVGKAATLAPRFFDDYYNRVHFSALHYILGSITAGVARTLTIWNAYLLPKSIGITASESTEGVAVSGFGAAGPETAPPLGLSTTTFTVGVSGSPMLRARYTFTIA